MCCLCVCMCRIFYTGTFITCCCAYGTTGWFFCLFIICGNNLHIWIVTSVLMIITTIWCSIHWESCGCGACGNRWIGGIIITYSYYVDCFRTISWLNTRRYNIAYYQHITVIISTKRKWHHNMQPVIKWSGSKRHQAAEIISYFPKSYGTYFELILERFVPLTNHSSSLILVMLITSWYK